MTSYVSINGTLVPEDQASFPIKLSGLETGAGVFTTARVVDGRIECLQAHLDRLAQHARQHGLDLPEIKLEYFADLVTTNQALTGTYRLKAMIIPTKLEPRSWGKTSLVIYLDPYTSQLPAELHLGMHCFDPSPLTARIKTLSRLERRMLWMKAQTEGLHECLMATSKGILLEALWANIFWIHQNMLYMPDPALPYMVGIVIANIEQAAKAMDVPIKYVTSRLEDIPDDAKLYISNALIWFKPVVQVGIRAFIRDQNFEQTLFTHLTCEIQRNSYVC